MPDDLTGLTIEEAALLLGRTARALPTPLEGDGYRTLAHDRGAQLDRIAAILRRFHGAELSASSVGGVGTADAGRCEGRCEGRCGGRCEGQRVTETGEPVCSEACYRAWIAHLEAGR